eukprot:3289890-Pleurochrysis_carterae.AAC.1
MFRVCAHTLHTSVAPAHAEMIAGGQRGCSACGTKAHKYQARQTIRDNSQRGNASFTFTAHDGSGPAAASRRDDRLVPEIFGKSRSAPFTPKPALLPSTKGRRRPEQLVAVGPHGARLKLTSDALAPRRVFRKYCMGQPVGRVIRQTDRFRLR